MRKLVFALFVAAACGGDDDPGGADGDIDEVARCSGATSDRYFPFTVGNSWEFRVTDPMSGEVYTKLQSLDEEVTPEGETEPVIVQTTTKANGRTESWNRVMGDAIVRIRQQDFDGAGALELTTEYAPHNLRIDESAQRMSAGNSWDETYDESHFDPAGVMIDTITTTDRWTVESLDEPCQAPIGPTTCVHLRRVRTAGGIADKEFWYAKGVGKIRETGGQTEELVSCSLE
jgi:hypothetical protein